MPSLSALTDDLIRHIAVGFLDELYDMVMLSSACGSLRQYLDDPIAEARATLPPPYSPAALDAALLTGDAETAAPLVDAMCVRLRKNLCVIKGRLEALGYPLSTHCDVSGRPLLTPEEDLDNLLSPLEEYGLRIPLVLEVLWRTLGGVIFGSPHDAAHVGWWQQQIPGLGPRHVDPLWIDHAAAALANVHPESEVTLPIDFSDDEGFLFRTAPVANLAPDAFSKGHCRGTPLAEIGSYACWLEASPPLCPKLLRFEGGSAADMQQAFGSCSLVRYLRLAVLEAGGFPGLLGTEGFEGLRQELVADLKPF
jgi:hypothetical protein